MKTSLHLYTEQSEEPVFWQMLDHAINLKEGDVFEYGQRDYDELESKLQKEFDSSGAKLGKYVVDSTSIENNNAFYGKYKSLFLKPL
jgi:hypothetical protein